MPPPSEAKRRALQIPLTYYRSPDLLAWWRRVLLGLAALGTVVWLGAGLVESDRTVRRYSPGELAQPHQMWDTQCAACHREFAALQTVAFGADRPGGTASNQMQQSFDRLCQACHLGPAHHPTQRPEEVGTCASCHREHQGRTATIARPDDHVCTQCHANLAAHTRSVPGVSEFEPPLDPSITRFDLDHPDFRSLERDPGNIKFTHGRHMSLGLKIPTAGPEAGTDHDPQMSLDEVARRDPQHFERYRRFVDRETGLVQLECSTCHQSDSGELAELAPPSGPLAPMSGEYMAPTNYERDCRSCHPLRFPVVMTGQVESDSAAWAAIPHGLKPDAIRDFVRGAVVRELARRGEAAFRDESVALEAIIPGARPEPDRIGLETLVERQIGFAERHLYAETCNLCHSFAPPSEADESPGAMPEVLPANLPQVWLKHARFDHAAHRALDCRECHAGAYPDAGANNVSAREASQRVLIAGREVCVECHRPRPAEQAVGGARFDCVECHTYHAGARPDDEPHYRQSRGATARDPAEQRDLHEFLRGRP